MTHVWVLSEESPFEDPDASGGCVCGVYATAAAAVFDLGTSEIGVEALAAMTWEQWTPTCYYGTGWRTAFYVLQRYAVQEEATLRAADLANRRLAHLAPEPFLALSSAELVALVSAEEPNL